MTQNQPRFPEIKVYLLLKPVYAVIVKGIFCSHLSESLRRLPDLDHAAVVSGEEEMTLDIKHGAVNVAQVTSQLLGVSALYFSSWIL